VALFWIAAHLQTIDPGGQSAFAGESVVESDQIAPNAKQKATPPQMPSQQYANEE